MAIADPNVLLVLNDASGTTVTNDGTQADVAIGVHSGGTAQYDWNQDQGSYDGYLDINAASGSNQTFVDASALTYASTLDEESLAIRFNLLSRDALGTGYIVGQSGDATETQGQIVVRAVNATSTGDFDLECHCKSSGGAGKDTTASSTFQDLSYSTDYALAISVDRTTDTATQARFKLDANATYSPSTSNENGAAINTSGFYIGRGNGFSNYYGITGRIYYAAYWRGYALTDAELGNVNSDPAAYIPLWPSGSVDTPITVPTGPWY